MSTVAQPRPADRPDMLAAALRAADAGLCVVPPVEDGTKRPLGNWKRFQSEVVDADQIRAWYGSGQITGLGLVCGSVSGGLELLELDADFYSDFQRAARALGMGSLLERIEAGYLERTPGGGWHLLYRCPTPNGNTKLAQQPGPIGNNGRPTIDVLIESRGEGGYVVVAPSHGKVHPSGNAYSLQRGGFGSIATIANAERDALWGLARSFDRMPAMPSGEPTVEKPRGRPPAGGPRLRPGDDFNQRMTWSAILEPRGWLLVHTQGDTGYWRRPDKSEGWSATTNHGGSGLLWVFTSSSEFEPEKSYSKFGAYARLEHGGDFAAATRALAKLDYGEPERSRVVPSSRPPLRVVGVEGEGEGDRPTDNGPASDGGTGGDSRPRIVISPEEMLVNDQAIAAIAGDPAVFHLGPILATVIHGGAPTTHRNVEHRDGPPPRVTGISSATLRERMANRAIWLAERIDRKGEVYTVRDHPPSWSVSAVMDRGYWPGVRPLLGVIEAPTMRPDGSILAKPGYDAATMLYLHPGETFPAVPDRPSREQARRAAEVLLDLVVDFPFVGPEHRAAWLAALLSVVARSAVVGPVPLFALDANSPGSGKSLLADLVATIASGRRIARTIWPTGRDSDDEMRKRITSLALAGELMILIDNVAAGQPIGGAPLDAALTSTTWKDRILGRTETTSELPLRAVWFATGNNLSFKTDILRRVIPVRIVTDEERPEERQEFRYPELLEHARAERPRLLTAALTILRAYHVAGRPCEVKALGSYEGWSHLIAGAVRWATGCDPLEARETIKVEDPESIRRRALFEGLAAVPGISAGMTASEIRTAVNQDVSGILDGLKEALMEFARGEELPSAKIIGQQFRLLRDRVIGAYRLTSHEDSHRKILQWYLKPVERSAGFAGNCGVSCQPFADEKNKCSSNGHPPHFDKPTTDGRQVTPHNPANPATGSDREEFIV